MKEQDLLTRIGGWFWGVVAILLGAVVALLVLFWLIGFIVQHAH